MRRATSSENNTASATVKPNCLKYWPAMPPMKLAGAKIATEIASWGQEWLAVGDERPVHDALSFLANHRGRLDYARASQQGRPVGSGAVEATCKSLIAVRFKRPGARWKQPSADRIIQLRALALSDRWGDAIELTLEHQRREVRVAA